MLTTNNHEITHATNVRDRSPLVMHQTDFLFKDGSFERIINGTEEIDSKNTEDLMDDHDDDVSLSWTNTKHSQSVDRLLVVSLGLSSIRLRSI
jgi:hypothetical protein